MLHVENDDASSMDNGDETLPILEPIVAPVSEAPPRPRSTVATVTPQRSTAMDGSSDDDEMRQQCRRQRQREQWVQHILRSEPLPASTDDDDDDAALRNAIRMLQQRVVLSAEEASTAVADATALRHDLAVERQHRAAQAARMAALEQQVQALHQRNAKLVIERRVLKQAYTRLKQHSTMALERYVEQALYQHEEQLVAEGRCRRNVSKTTDVDSATTTSSSSSEDEDDDDDGFEALEHMTADEPATPEGCTVIAQDDDDDDSDWIPTALAVPYTPVRIVPSDERGKSSSGKRRARASTTPRQPMLSLLDEQKIVERSGTPTTSSSDTTAGTTPSATPPGRPTTTTVVVTTTSDPLMFRSLAIPMH